jgi:Flp pilus assembly protein TadD
VKRPWPCAVSIVLLLAACANSGGLGASKSPGRNTPPAADGSEMGVDGLLVGHRLMEAGEYELALKAYLRAASEQGINVDVLSALGSANLRLGRLGQSEKLFRRALEADPSFVPALNNLGVVLMEEQKIPEARVIFQQAFALDSGQTDSIRENLRLAIARLAVDVYDQPQEEKPVMNLVRRGHGSYVLLSQL